MTSSNEPQLTRRELRELERLREQQAGAATPDQASPPAVAPVHAAPPAPAPAAPPQYAPQPVAPQPVAAPMLPAQPPAQAPQQQIPAAYPASGQGFAPPRPAGGFGQAAPLTAVPPQAPQNPFAPRPSAPPAAEAPSQPAVPAAAQAPSPSMPSAPERTLTRRELRAMLDGAQLDDFDDEFDDEPVAPTAVASAAPGAPGVHGVPPHQPQAAQPQRLPQAMPASLATPQPAVNPLVDASVPNLPGVSAGSPGHWTSQLNVPAAEDRAEPFDQMLSRGALSHGVPTTTNALILPSLPDQGAFGNQLSQPGEVLATGSIDLPRSYGATGVHPSQVDSSDVDRLFEHQVEDVGTGVAPVAATRAISTQGAARTMISPPKKEGMNVPLVLAVTAGVLALGVVGTLVIGAMTGLF
ncbi:hypothetical protein [Agromyces italicus]|uniref:hypothetical protein n=1 Tax=Agromyces italicus TaxID=279572 RepID=UPI00040B0B14|nr:hypothetical protein [Agromyces italicus]